jgi:glutaredoxin-related protein
MKNPATSVVVAIICSAMILFSVTTCNGLSSKVGPMSRAKPNPIVKAMANGMTLLKPAFVAEAKLQASVLGSNIDRQQVTSEIDAEIKSNPIVIYTYGLSPFSTEAIAILDNTGYKYKMIEVGAEWFLLSGKDSVKRVLLSEFVENGATSLPKVFVGGQCIGGCAELAAKVESGEFDDLVNSGKKPKNKFLPFL